MSCRGEGPRVLQRGRDSCPAEGKGLVSCRGEAKGLVSCRGEGPRVLQRGRASFSLGDSVLRGEGLIPLKWGEEGLTHSEGAPIRCRMGGSPQMHQWGREDGLSSYPSDVGGARAIRCWR